MPNKRIPLALIGVLTLTGTAVAWLVWSPRPEPGSSWAPTASTTPEESTRPNASAGVGGPARAAATLPPPAPSSDATALPTFSEPVRDRARADRLREAMTALIAAEHGGAGGGAGIAPNGDPERDPRLAGYVTRVMENHFLPVAAGCYELLLSARASARGDVVLELSIVGQPSVGAVVLEPTITLGSGLRQDTFEACLKDAMNALVFEAPPAGHTSLSVKQSFELSP